MTKYIQLGFIFHLLHLVKKILKSVDIPSPTVARLVCKLIPASCPFERDIKLLGNTVVHFPPLCKLNPFYKQAIGLRFKCLCYLADVCGEDISVYC